MLEIFKSIRNKILNEDMGTPNEVPNVDMDSAQDASAEKGVPPAPEPQEEDQTDNEAVESGLKEGEKIYLGATLTEHYYLIFKDNDILLCDAAGRVIMSGTDKMGDQWDPNDVDQQVEFIKVIASEVKPNIATSTLEKFGFFDEKEPEPEATVGEEGPQLGAMSDGGMPASASGAGNPGNPAMGEEVAGPEMTPPEPKKPDYKPLSKEPGASALDQLEVESSPESSEASEGQPEAKEIPGTDTPEEPNLFGTEGSLKGASNRTLNPAFKGVRESLDESTLNEDMEVAKTIVQQLGGQGRLKAMIGAKNFSGTGNSVSFMLARAKDGINGITITLNAMDTYDIKFWSLKGLAKYNVVKEVKGIYVDDLKNTIEQTTGLYLSLGTMGRNESLEVEPAQKQNKAEVNPSAVGKQTDKVKDPVIVNDEGEIQEGKVSPSAKTCPKCGDELTDVGNKEDGSKITCGGCGKSFKIGESVNEASGLYNNTEALYILNIDSIDEIYHSPDYNGQGDLEDAINAYDPVALKLARQIVDGELEAMGVNCTVKSVEPHIGSGKYYQGSMYMSVILDVNDDNSMAVLDSEDSPFQVIGGQKQTNEIANKYGLSDAKNDADSTIPEDGKSGMYYEEGLEESIKKLTDKYLGT